VKVNINTPGIEKQFLFLQNYPNPFKSTTNIEFTLSRESQVKIEVFNIHGQLIKPLLHARKSAGQHVVEFNGDHLTRGVYFC
jgi:hypothetical protein